MSEYTIQDWMDVAGKKNLVQEAQIALEFAGSIDLGVYSLLNLIQDLRPFVEAEEDLINISKALGILPMILSRLQIEPSRHDVNTLMNYFCVRLSNFKSYPSFRAGVREVASSLQVIVNWNHFVPSESTTITSAIFGLARTSDYKDLTWETRYEVCKVLDYLFRNRAQALIRASGIKPQIDGLISVAEFEKNPSCLGVLLSLYTHLGKDWDLEAEEFQKLWDVYHRFYPLQAGLVAKPNQPSREQLQRMLVECILSNDYYAKEAIPMCLERLDTQAALAETKDEIFQTLTACIKTYSVPAVAPWVSKIWDCLKFEIWNGENDDFVSTSLNVLRTLSTSLSRSAYDWEDQASPLALYIISASKECTSRIHDSKKQFMRSSGMILRSIGSGSPLAFQLVAKHCLPSLNVLWQDLRLGSEKNLLLGVFNNIFFARLAQPDASPPSTASVEGLSAENIDAQQNVYKMKDDFEKFSGSLIDIFFGAMAEPDPAFGASAIKGLCLLFRIPDFLTPAEQVMVVEKLNDYAVNPVQDSEISTAVVEALQQISAVDPKGFADITLSNFIHKLPGSVSEEPRQREQDMELILSQLQSLVNICCTTICRTELKDGPPPGAAGSFWYRNFDAMAQRLVANLETVIHKKGQVSYALAIIATIVNGLEQFDQTVDKARLNSTEPPPAIPASGPFTYIIMALFSTIVAQKVDSKGQIYLGVKPSIQIHGVDDIFVEFVGKAAMLALRSKSTTPRNNFMLNWNGTFVREPSVIWTLFTHTEDKLLSTTQMKLENGPADKCSANALSMYLLAGTQPKDSGSLKIPIGDVAAAMIRNAVSITSQSSRISQTSMLWMVQLLVNKFGAAKVTLFDGTKLLDIMKELIGNYSSMSGSQAAKVYQVLAYIATASLASFDPTMVTLINLMIDGVTDSTHGRRVAQSFRILLESSPILNEHNFCTIRKLRYPRLYSMAVEPMISLWQSASNKTTKENYLIAIAGVLAYMDSKWLTEGDTAERLYPVILEGVTVKDDDWTKVSFLKTLVGLIPLCPKLTQEHLDSVLNRISDRIRNTYHSPSDGSVDCRVQALEVLLMLVRHMKPTLLLQRSVKVLKELDLAIDDVAWEVRKKATRCKMEWWLMADKAKARDT